MRRERTQAYGDQFEFLADCFELIRKRGDAFNIRTEALETERMVGYSERTGYSSERSQLLEIYRDIETEIRNVHDRIEERRVETGSDSSTPSRFPLDLFRERYALESDEVQILLVLLYNESLGRSHARFTTGTEILNLLFPNPVSALKASKFLDGGATLLEKGLIRAVSDDGSTNFLRADSVIV